MVWVLFLIGLIGGCLTGLMSVGGGLLTIFFLLFIPPLFGHTYSMHLIAGMVIIQTIFSSCSGMVTYWKSQMISPFLIRYMGLSTFIGGGIGSLLAGRYFSNSQLLFVFAFLSLISVASMFIKRNDASSEPNENKRWACSLGLGIGVLGGMFGLSAGFLLVPVMLHIFRLPPKHAVGTGLAVGIALCCGALLINILQFTVPWSEGLFLALGAIPGAQVGSRIGKTINNTHLRHIMAVAIAIVAIKIWINLFIDLGLSYMTITYVFAGIAIFLMLVFLLMRNTLVTKKQSLPLRRKHTNKRNQAL